MRQKRLFPRTTGILAAGLLLAALAAPAMAGPAGWTGGDDDRAFLGVYTRELDDPLREALGFDEDGVLVEDVVKGSAADEAGVKAGDILVTLDGRAITSPQRLRRLITKYDPGDTVKLEVWRKGKRVKMDIALGKPKPRKVKIHAEGPWIWNKGGDIRIMMGDDRAYLGIHPDDLSPQLGEYFGVEDGKGVLIREVKEDSPAAEAGLKAGDVIVAMDGEEIEEMDDLFDVLADHEPGDEVEVAYLRKGKKATVKVTLAEPPEKDEDDFEFYISPRGKRGMRFTSPERWRRGGVILEDLDDILEALPAPPEPPEAWSRYRRIPQ